MLVNSLVIKPTKWSVRPAKTQISLGIRPVWSESSLCAQWVDQDLSFLHANREDSDQTGQPPRLIRAFAGRTCHLLVLSWGGSFWKTMVKAYQIWKILTPQNCCTCNFPRIWKRWFMIHYRKFPKYSDTQNIWCNHSKIWTMWLYHRVMSPNDAYRMANSVDPDQTAPLGAVWSGSALFAQAYLSKNLGSLR